MGRDKRKKSVSRRRLNWEDSQEHYQALNEIETKHNMIGGFETEKDAFTSSNQRKKAEANVYNETRKYLADNDLVYELGGFYVED